MSEGQPQGHTPESPRPKGQEKRHFTRGGKQIKGFYYYASEYQRNKQTKERKSKIHKVFRSVIEPFAIHVRAARLRMAARRHGGGDSAVLSSEFVKTALDRPFGRGFKTAEGQKVAHRFGALSKAHGIVEDAKGANLSEEEQAKTRGVISDILAAGGELTPEQMADYAKRMGVDVTTIQTLSETLVQAKDVLQTPEQFQQSVPDQILFGGLSPAQQEKARELAIAAHRMTIAAALNYAKIPLLVMLATTPLGAAGFLVNAAISGATSYAGRHTRLTTEEHTYDVSKSKGIDIPTIKKGFFGRIFSVDWEADPETRKAQKIRAGLVGVAVGLALKVAGPHIADAWHHPTEAVHGAGRALDSAAHPTEVHDVAGGSTHTSEFLGKYTDHHTPTYFQPDTADHNWQRLHSYVFDNGGHKAIKLAYEPKDPTPGVNPDHYQISLFTHGSNPNNGEIFIQNNAIIDPQSNAAVTIFNAQHEVVGHMQSAQLAQLLGVNDAKIDRFAQMSQSWIQQHGNNSLADDVLKGAGNQSYTQHASDLYNEIPQQAGQFAHGADSLYTMRIGGGYYQDGAFHIGASNHYFGGSIPDSLKGIAGFSETSEHFTSVLAPGLQTVDTYEDNALTWLGQHGIPSGVLNVADNATDFGLNNMDRLAQFTEDNTHIAALASVPYLASGIGGFLYGRNHANKKPSKKNVAAGVGTEAALLWALPGAAITAGLGYLAGRALGKKKEKGKKNPSSENQITPETPSVQPPASPANGGAGSEPAVPESVSPAVIEEAAATIPAGSPPPPPAAPTDSEPTETSGSVESRGSIADGGVSVNLVQPLAAPVAPAFPGEAAATLPTEQTPVVATEATLPTEEESIVPPSAETEQRAAGVENLESTAQAEGFRTPQTVGQALSELDEYEQQLQGRDDDDAKNQRRKIEHLRKELQGKDPSEQVSFGNEHFWIDAFRPKREEPQQPAA